MLLSNIMRAAPFWLIVESDRLKRSEPGRYLDLGGLEKNMKRHSAVVLMAREG